MVHHFQKIYCPNQDRSSNVEKRKVCVKDSVSCSVSLRADVSYFLPPAEKGCLRNGIANRVPVSCCSGFKFRINYDHRVLFSMPESFPSDRSMIGGRTGLRGGI